MQIEKVKIENLNPAKYNPRKDLKPGDAEYEKLKRSLEEFGYVEPIVWNKTTGNIVGGHQRYKLLLESGVSAIECVIVELDETKEKALNIALNKINGDWDKEKLAFLISDLKGSDFDVSLTGFEEEEIADLLAWADDSEVKEDDFDLTKALEEASFVKREDMWTVGNHRLMCGDATDAEDVRHLMHGKKANLILTDPPYSVSVQSRSGLTIMNDSMKSEDFYDFLFKSFSNMAENLENESSAYVFHADTEGENFRKAFSEAGFKLSEVCIWSKNSFVIGRAPYHWQHEPILFGWLKSGKHKWYAGRKESTIWNFNRPIKNENHPTAKPLDLLAYPIKNSCQVNGIVMDLFGGSGSTLLAAEQINRICYMMELDEKYASVILRRYYQNFPEAEIICERKGQKLKFSELVK
ncbi:MAG: DNA modification methylase [Oscillospiraceae bacterium]|jgi:DNA modification methylase|nr:DNA modification methylase [Oscillospiraceae bacterium]